MSESGTGSRGEAAPVPERVGEWGDEMAARPVVAERTAFAGRIFDVVSRDVDLGEAGVVTREFVRHPGAVAVVVLREGTAGTDDDETQVLLLRQYRVPVGGYLWEIPAGLLDGGDDESLLAAAQRELAEEADLVAARWDVLVDFATTPGSNSEVIRIFLAREVSPAPKSSFVREGEESEIRLEWVPLADATRAVLEGRMHSPSGNLGVLAAALSEQSGFADLRDVSTPSLLRPDVAPA